MEAHVTMTTIDEEYERIFADMDKHKKFIEQHPFLNFILDYPSVINPRQKPLSPEETQKFMDFVSNLRKKFGTVFVIPHVNTNNLNDGEN